MFKYIFWAGSIKGLTDDIELMSENYVKALHKVMKYISLNKVTKHPLRGIKPSVWD